VARTPAARQGSILCAHPLPVNGEGNLHRVSLVLQEGVMSIIAWAAGAGARQQKPLKSNQNFHRFRTGSGGVWPARKAATS
jgi:hypothetical protein